MENLQNFEFFHFLRHCDITALENDVIESYGNGTFNAKMILNAFACFEKPLAPIWKLRHHYVIVICYVRSHFQSKIIEILDKWLDSLGIL